VAGEAVCWWQSLIDTPARLPLRSPGRYVHRAEGKLGAELIASARRLQNQQLRAAVTADSEVLQLPLCMGVSTSQLPTLPVGVMHCISHRISASDTASSAAYCA
jgi:hypothetical protein